MPNIFTYRSLESELMDAPDVSEALLFRNLDELDTLNRYSGGHSVTLNGIKRLINGNTTNYTIVDLGCGSGDALRYIADWARKNAFTFNLVGVDKNPEAINYLKNHCRDYPEIKGIVSDVSEYFDNQNSVDIVISSLFFHHLNDSDILDIIDQSQQKVKLGMVINDLQRNRIAYFGAWLIPRLLNGTYLSKNDGPLSVLKAFKKNELELLLKTAGIKKYTIEWKWLFRYLVICDYRKSIE